MIYRTLWGEIKYFCCCCYWNGALGICLFVANTLVDKYTDLIINNIQSHLLISFSNQSSKSFSAPSKFPQALLMSCMNMTTYQTRNTNILNKQQLCIIQQNAIFCWYFFHSHTDSVHLHRWPWILLLGI